MIEISSIALTLQYEEFDLHLMKRSGYDQVKIFLRLSHYNLLHGLGEFFECDSLFELTFFEETNELLPDCETYFVNHPITEGLAHFFCRNLSIFIVV